MAGKLTSIFTFLLFFQLQSALSQINPPELLCLKGDTLVWDLPVNPCGPFIGLEIYYSDQRGGPYTLLTVIADELEREFIHNPGGVQDRYYYLRLIYGCPGMYSNPSDTLDNKPPRAPFVNHVSVLNGQVEISWQNSTSPQTKRYIIYRATAQGTVPIDTVENINVYIDTGANPNDKIEFYYVLAMDDCEIKSPFDELHNTIFPELTYDSCTREALLVWNEYNYWPTGIMDYEVYVQIDGAAPILGAIRAPDDRSFSFTGLQNGREYCFWVEAKETGTLNTARSSIKCIRPQIIVPVDLLCLSRINTGENGQIELFWHVNNNADIEYMRIVRSTSITGPFTPISNYTALTSSTYTYVDLTANGNNTVYYYRIETLDKCGVMNQSSIGSNLVLGAELLPGRINNLFFNSFYLENSDLIDYEIYRLNGQSLNSLALLDPSSASYEDIISGPSVGNTQFCYRLAANYTQVCPGTVEPSFSNIACVEQNSSIFAPNAFAPNGQNKIFKPVILYQESIVNYQMLIFDRWGSVLFESANPDSGWDGTINGQAIPMGTYVFVIKATQANGRKIEEKGTVTLIR